jgi:hypothetical protein
MFKLMTAALAVGSALALIALNADTASAAERKAAAAPAPAVVEGGHRASSYYRRGPQVRGFSQRRGGYSYSATDTINTYGNNRSIFGGANSYRDGFLDRQTLGGPFDHGFFFDSGIGPRGGNSPYQN